MAFSIESQPIAEALTQFANQSGYQLLFPSHLARSITSPRVRGSLSPKGALELLLRNTELTYEFVNASTISIQSKTRDVTSTPTFLLGDEYTNVESLPVALTAEGANNSDERELESPSSSDAERGSSGERLTNASQPEVLVTGTRIHGEAPAGSPVSIYDREYIERSGYLSSGDLIRGIPESFSGGQNPAVVGATGGNNAKNIGLVSTANLRGLGSDATLTLFNGRRIAVSGYQDSVDVSGIPVDAIKRVEVLKDGASAQYGSDAVGGVVNFVLRDDFEGAQLSASLLTPTRSGGGEQSKYNMLLGTNWSSGNVMADYEFSESSVLLSSDREFSTGAGSPGNSLFPELKQHSFFVSGHQELGSGKRLFIQSLASRRTGSDRVVFPGLLETFNRQEITQANISSGLEFSLPSEWRGELAGTYGRSKIEADSKSVFSFGETSTFSPFKNTAYSGELSASGGIAEIPGGSIKAALGLGYRHEEFINNSFSQGRLAGSTRGARDVKSSFLELNFPLISKLNNRRGAESLVFNAAGRFEEYSDAGDSSVPRFGVAYSPVDSVAFRGTWGKAFKAPTFSQQFTGSQVGLLVLPDPASSRGSSIVLLRTGGNENLVAQTAKTWTAGLDWSPKWTVPFAAHLTYFNIDYDGKVAAPVNSIPTALIDRANAPFIVRQPSSAMQQSEIDDALSFFNASGVPYDPANVAALIFNQNQNVSSQKIEGIDLSVNASWESGIGLWTFFGNGTWLNFRQKLTEFSPDQTIEGTLFNPAKRKARAGFSWDRSGVSLGANLNYVSGSLDNVQIPAREVSSFVTADVLASYRPTEMQAQGYLAGTRFVVGVQNALDRNPPSLAESSTSPRGLGYDSTNASAFGRTIQVLVQKGW